MAGDLDLPEVALLSDGSSVLRAPVPVLHEYGRLKIALDPSDVRRSPFYEGDLARNEALGLAAFRLRERDEFKQQKVNEAGAGANWSGGDGRSPLDPPLAPTKPLTLGSSHPGPSLASPPSSRRTGYRLAGRIGVGVLIVSGSGSLQISSAEEQTIVAQIQNGLGWLASQSPAKDVTFVYNNDFETVSVADDPHGADFETCERGWRDAALAQLGYPSGSAGLGAYTAALKSQLNVSQLYIALFTKYSLFHFAYAYPGTVPYTVMNYWNDGWKVPFLDRVFAHETCHIFGAPDEYSLAGCNCGGAWGFFGVPNINCESCAPNGGVDCIMRQNTLAMCSATPYHVGFNGLPQWTTVISSSLAPVV